MPIRSRSAANPDLTNVYRKDQVTGKVELVSRASGTNGAAAARNSYAPQISGNGNLVTFTTEAALFARPTSTASSTCIRAT